MSSDNRTWIPRESPFHNLANSNSLTFRKFLLNYCWQARYLWFKKKKSKLVPYLCGRGKGCGPWERVAIFFCLDLQAGLSFISDNLGKSQAAGTDGPHDVELELSQKWPKGYFKGWSRHNVSDVLRSDLRMIFARYRSFLSSWSWSLLGLKTATYMDQVFCFCWAACFWHGSWTDAFPES